MTNIEETVFIPGLVPIICNPALNTSAVGESDPDTIASASFIFTIIAP